MGPTDPAFLAVGHLTRVHGLLGEFFVTSLTDHPEGAFAPGVVLRLGDPSGTAPDQDLPPLRVEEARPFKGGLLVAFGGVASRSEAERIRGRYLLQATEQLEPPAPGEFWHHQLIGLEVVTVEGRRVGVVRELLEVAACDLLDVVDGDVEHLIPFRKEFVVQVDVEGGRVVVDPPAGLLDL